jgi:DHA3 family tetracycline resistance protein-like MFS transporter
MADGSVLGRVGVFRPLRIRDFALLWTGLSISLLGDGIYFVAIAWQVYELSNVPTALSVVGLAWAVPAVVFLLVGGVISDRFERRKVLIVSDVVRGGAVAAIGVLSLAGALELWHVIALVALWGIGESLFGPAFGALVPDIVPQHLIVQANSLDMVMRPLGAQLLGPALGGLAVDSIGLGAAFLLDAASFGVSALCLLAISRRPVERDPAKPPSAVAEIAEGFRFVRSQTWLWGTLAAAAVFLLVFYGPWEVLVPYVVKNDLDGDAGDVGLVYASAGFGAVVAALAMGQRSLPRRHITVMYASWTLGALVLAAYGLAADLWQAMVAGVFRGAGMTCGLIIWMSLMQTRVPRHLLGRVTSVDWFISIGLVPVSFALTGPVAAAVGAQETLIGAGVLGAAVTAAFYFLPGIRETERAAERSSAEGITATDT